MMGPRLERLSDGSIRLNELAPWFASVLAQLPEILDSDQPEAVSQRLYPEPSDDPDIQESWDKYVRPDLFALVATAREIVLRDLGNMGPASIVEPPPDPDADEEDEETAFWGGLAFWTLEIPAAHVQAWISALNVARLTLSTRFAVEDDELFEEEQELLEGDDEATRERRRELETKQLAITSIHLLGYLQQMLIEADSPTPSDFEYPWLPEEEDEPEDHEGPEN